MFDKTTKLFSSAPIHPVTSCDSVWFPRPLILSDASAQKTQTSKRLNVLRWRLWWWTCTFMWLLWATQHAKLYLWSKSAMVKSVSFFVFKSFDLSVFFSVEYRFHLLVWICPECLIFRDFIVWRSDVYQVIKINDFGTIQFIVSPCFHAVVFFFFTGSTLAQISFTPKLNLWQKASKTRGMSSLLCAD